MLSLRGMRCLQAAVWLIVAANAGASGSPPTVAGDPPSRVIAEHTYYFEASASDPDGDKVTWTIRNKPPWATFWSGQGRLFGTPTRNDVGTYGNIVIEAHDGTNTVRLQSFSITVDPTWVNNQRPTITGDAREVVAPGQWYSFDPVGADPDDHSLTYTIGNRPPWATFHPYSGRLYGRPKSWQTGTYDNIRIWVTDGQLTQQLPAFSIRVGDSGGGSGNNPPTIAGDPSRAVVVGNTWSLNLEASDPDGDPLTYSIRNKPTWLTFWSGAGRLFGEPSSSDVGWHGQIEISVSDGMTSTALPTFAIRVDAPTVSNSAPQISGSPRTAIEPTRWYKFEPVASDPDGHALEFSVVNKPTWARFDTTTGKLYGRPTWGDVGVYSDIRIRVTDGIATRSLPAFAIAVGDAATVSTTLSWTPPTQNTDGSPLLDLNGYYIYYGTSSGSYPNKITLWNEGLTSYVVDGLAPGTYCFVMTAFNSSGVESNRSVEACKSVQ